MTVLSKPAKYNWFTPLPYTCHEIFHTWNPSCKSAQRFVVLQAIKNTGIIYAILYLLKLLWRLTKGKREKKNMLKIYITDVLQSTLFMTVNSFSFVLLLCTAYKLFGKFYSEFGFVVGFLSGFIALPFEKKNRRVILANYIGNLAIETVYNMMLSRHIIKPIKNVETIVFSASVGLLLGFYRINFALPSTLKSNISFLLSENDSNLFGQLRISPKLADLFVRVCKVGPKHSLCSHEAACLQHALVGGVRNFLFGFLVDLLFNSRSLYRCLFLRTDAKISFNFQVCKFLASFISFYRISDCGLKYLFDKRCPKLMQFAPGAIAGISLKYYPSKTLAIYCLMKAIQVINEAVINKGWIYEIPNAAHIIYSISFGVLLHALLFEPHNIRPSYYRFMCRISNNKFRTIFRKLLDDAGTQASFLNPNFIPNLNVDNVSSPKVLQLLQRRNL